MIYLDNAATTMPKPPGVYEAVKEALLTCASIGRSGHAPARRAAELAFSCRKLAATLFDAEPEQVVFTMNATHGLNLAIKSLVSPGDSVVVSGFEHNSVLRTLFAQKAKIIVAGNKLFDPEDTLNAFSNTVTAETKAVVCTHVSNVFGYILPLEEIAALCAARHVPLIIDAAQSAGVLPISLRKTNAAFIAMPGHKALFGPQGTGLLLCNQGCEPLFHGGTGSLSASMEMPEFLPDRLEAGTQNTPGIAGLLAGMEFVQKKGPEAIRAHEQKLTKQLLDIFSQNSEIRVFRGSPKTQIGVVSFQIAGIDSEIAAQKLGERGIAVRAGLHCAPLAHASAGTQSEGTVRASLSALTKAEELNSFSEQLYEIFKL